MPLFVTGHKNANHHFHSQGLNPGHLCARPTCYSIAMKAGLYYKAVQVHVYHIPITTTYYSSSFRFVPNSQFEQPLNTRLPSLLGHQAHQMELFTISSKWYRCKHSNHHCHCLGSNPGHLRNRPTLYHVAIKVCLYRNAVKVYLVPITTTSIQSIITGLYQLKRWTQARHKWNV